MLQPSETGPLTARRPPGPTSARSLICIEQTSAMFFPLILDDRALLVSRAPSHSADVTAPLYEGAGDGAAAARLHGTWTGTTSGSSDYTVRLIPSTLIYRGCGFFNPDKPIRKYTKKELHDLLYKEPTKIKVESINLTFEGLIPRIQKSFLSKEVDAMQPHIRAFVERAVTFTTCPECDGTRLSKEARSSKIKGKNIAERLRDADQRPGRLGPGARRAVSWPRCSLGCNTSSTRSRRSVWDTSHSTGRRAPCPGGRHSAPR